MNKIKAVLIASLTVLSARLGILFVPVMLLVGLNIADYITALMACKYRGQEIDSLKGIKGITKKVLMWLLVLIGSGLDWLLIATGQHLGITIPFTFAIAILVAIWLVFNEMVSILENIADMGVRIPPFLLPLVKNLKSQVEDKSKAKEEN